MNQIPPLAWVAIIFIVILTLAINFSLITFLRNRDSMDEFLRRRQSRHSPQTSQSMQKLVEVARHPFGEEQKQLDELSELVARLNKPPDSTSGEASQPPEETEKNH
ncbi:MAG TPA: hypothetical protein VF823_05250 [Anaerolineales bacterium]